MGKKLTDRVTWVGKVDWELKTFHGDELSTNCGSSYNSYLIRDQKNVLIDTAWLPYSREFVKNLKQEIDLKDIDYIVMCHNEIDHSGNRETRGGLYDSIRDAKALARRLNTEEAIK